MKRIITLLTFCLISVSSFAQIPQALTYQAIARNAAGSALTSTNIAIRISIKDLTATGTTVYSETFTPTTNQFGLFTLSIGTGSTSGNFSTINWATGAKFMKVEMDPAGGTSYIDMGTSQMLSVPYALVAGSVIGGGGSGDDWGTQTVVSNPALNGSGTTGSPLDIAQQGATNGQVLKWNGSTWAPSNDIGGGTGDNWGTQSVITNSTLSGSGITGNVLGLSQQGAVNGQVLKWNGASWAPATDVDNDAQQLSINGSNLTISNGNTVTLPGGGTNYTAGTGISIVGTVISNTGDNDNSSTNEIQSLNLVGNQLTLSLGGGSVTLPTGTTYTAGTGISLGGNTITNTAPDQTVVLTAGTGISITSAYPNFTINATGGGGGIGGSGTLNYIPKFTPNGTTLGNSRMFDNGTQLGVDITLPTDFLHLNSTTANYVGINMTNPTTGTLTTDGFYVGMNSAAGDGLLFEAENQPIGIFTNSLQRMNITAAGNVGIGIVAPLALLHASGTSATFLSRFTNTNASGYASLSENSAVAGTGTGSGVTGLTYQSGGYGLWGENDNATGTGVLGTGSNILGTTLIAGSGGAFAGFDFGLISRNTDFALSIDQAAIYTLDGSSAPTAADEVLINYWDATNVHYKIFGGGTVSTIVDDLNGSPVTLHAPESPEIYFEDFGQGQLINGVAHIDMDPILVKNIAVNDKHPLRVFIQLEGNCNGVYVENKTAGGFDVKELSNGTSDVSFQWHVVANRANQLEGGRWSHYEDARFEDATVNAQTKQVNKIDAISKESPGVVNNAPDINVESKVNSSKRK